MNGPVRRSASPSGGSALITVAPKSAAMRPASATARAVTSLPPGCASSKMVWPERGLRSSILLSSCKVSWRCRIAIRHASGDIGLAHLGAYVNHDADVPHVRRLQVRSAKQYTPGAGSARTRWGLRREKRQWPSRTVSSPHLRPWSLVPRSPSSLPHPSSRAKAAPWSMPFRATRPPSTATARPPLRPCTTCRRTTPCWSSSTPPTRRVCCPTSPPRGPSRMTSSLTLSSCAPASTSTTALRSPRPTSRPASTASGNRLKASPRCARRFTRASPRSRRPMRKRSRSV